jgi:hypothetical protein
VPCQSLVREACLLHRLPNTSTAYWQGWNRLRANVGDKFRAVFKAVSQAMARTPRSSSLVENLNSRLRNYFTLRRHLGSSYLDLLRFFLNHRRYMRSQLAERVGKSPRELMTATRTGSPCWASDRCKTSTPEPGRLIGLHRTNQPRRTSPTLNRRPPPRGRLLPKNGQK